MDLFILAAEPSADLQGSKLIEELLKHRPSLKIGAMAGPRMRELPIEVLYLMEELQVMGFLDVLTSLPHIARTFFAMRAKLLASKPKAIICIDYPGFNLRLAKSLRKKGYAGQLIHYVCPTVWAWGKKRIPLMEQTLDLLLTLFPFEAKYFSHRGSCQTPLAVRYVGHPLTSAIPPTGKRSPTSLLALFPGSRATEIERNFPLQLQVAKQLQQEDPSLQIAVSIAHPDRREAIQRIGQGAPLSLFPPEKTYELMQSCRIALATSGTVTLELALHKVPTVVNFAIRPIDLFIAQKIVRINLPFYCIVNIIASKGIFPELFGPNLTGERLFKEAKALWFDAKKREECEQECAAMRALLGEHRASEEAARLILEKISP